jgi:uncharacterized protein (TIGR03000 family)
MYSMVLMAALSTGANTPAIFWNHGGCYGGWGACYGCWGCTGCWGSGHGWGGGHWGGHRGWGCHGGHAGYNGYGSSGACAGCYGSWGNWGTCYGCHGCYGCYGCYGCGGGGGTFAPQSPMGVPPAEQVPAPEEKKDQAKPMGLNSRARLVVELPAEAKLYVDNYVSKATGKNVRTFNTPELEPGQTYYYELKAEMVLNGETVTETKRVILRPGSEIRTTFRELMAKERSPITVTSTK